MTTVHTNKSDRNHLADILKGICIVFVIVTHFGWSNEERLRYLFNFWIEMAVPIFMFLSGWANAVSFQRKGIDTAEKAYLPKNIIDKLIRYTVPFALAFLVEILLAAQRGDFGGMSLVQIVFAIGNVFLRGGYGPGSYYYPLLVQLIFVFPVIFFVIRKYKVSGLIFCGFVNAFYEIVKHVYGVDGDLYRLLLFRYTLLIAAGCFLALQGSKVRLWKASLSCAAGCAYLVAVCYLHYTPKFILYWKETSYLAALFIIPILFLLFDKCSNWKCKPIEIIGQASYHIFLTQMVWYCYYAEKIANRYGLNRGLQLLVNIGVSLIIGVLFYYAEKPLSKKLTAVSGKWIKS